VSDTGKKIILVVVGVVMALGVDEIVLQTCYLVRGDGPVALHRDYLANGNGVHR
jgi:hypothetical protein